MKIIYKIVDKLDDRTFYKLLTVLMLIFISIGLIGTLAVELNYQQKMNNLYKMNVDEMNEIMEMRQDVWELEEEVQHEDEIQSLGMFTCTAYCACEKCCGEYADGITASGTICEEGRTIAVDPKIIPLGTTVYMKNADGLLVPYVAEDVGGAIKENHIDIYMCEHEAALQFGVQEIELFIKR